MKKQNKLTSRLAHKLFFKTIYMHCSPAYRCMDIRTVGITKYKRSSTKDYTTMTTEKSTPHFSFFSFSQWIEPTKDWRKKVLVGIFVWLCVCVCVCLYVCLFVCLFVCGPKRRFLHWFLHWNEEREREREK